MLYSSVSKETIETPSAQQCVLNNFVEGLSELPLETMPGSRWKLRRDPWAKFLCLDEDGNYQEDL